MQHCDLYDDEDVYSAHEGLYHVAVAPNARLVVQSRIARAVASLPRPLTENQFYGAALMAEDNHFGIGRAWPQEHVELWCAISSQMWRVVDGVQQQLRERQILAESAANEQRVIGEVEDAA